MRKITALLSAFAIIITLSGCDKKKSESEPPEVEEVVTEAIEEDTEPVFRELKDEDFAPIDLNLSIVDKESPIDIQCADLSGIDFGKVLTPCKATDIVNQYYPHQEFDDPEKQELHDKNREALLNRESCGRIENIVHLGSKLYLDVNYDDLCSRHAERLFSYDLETGESKMLTEHIGLEYNGGFSALTAVHDKLIYINHINDSMGDIKGYELYRLEPDTGETTKLAEINGGEGYWLSWLEEVPEGLMVRGFINHEDEEGSNTFTNTAVFDTYDIETGEKLSTSHEETPFERTWGFCDGEPVEVSGGLKSDGTGSEPYTIKTQYYSIDTGMKNVGGVYAWKDRLCILVNERMTYGADEHRLYTYDLKTMERTKMKFNGFTGSVNKYGDGIISAVHTSAMEKGGYVALTQLYYILPEVGVAYRLDKIESENIYDLDDIFCLISYKKEERTNEEEEGYFYNGFNIPPDKLYWFYKK